MESATDLVEYNYEELTSITRGFSEENFIGNTLYGKVFRGKIQQDSETQEVVVKIWVNYDFTWPARIKVALEFACLLECLHELLHHSIGAAHLMIDQAFSPRLFDFPMLVGGGFGEIRSREYDLGSHGYSDPLIGLTGAWSYKSDVFSYGVVLLGLIAKRVFDLKKAKDLGELNAVYIWAWMEYGEPNKKPQCRYFKGTDTDTGKPRSKLWGMFKKQKESQSNKSLVDRSLESDEYFDVGDGVEITKLAIRCVDYYPEERPMMKEIVRCLRELNVVKKSSRIVVPKMSVCSSGGDGIAKGDLSRGKYGLRLTYQHGNLDSFHGGNLDFFHGGNPGGGNPGGGSPHYPVDLLALYRYTAFTGHEIDQFTDNLATRVGEGGFADVYVGRIGDQAIVVKVPKDGLTRKAEWQPHLNNLQQTNKPTRYACKTESIESVGEGKTREGKPDLIGEGKEEEHRATADRAEERETRGGSRAAVDHGKALMLDREGQIEGGSRAIKGEENRHAYPATS
ncbi:hypothetical protein RHMOL_Rhmol09G0192500 [Rhododendron molle]|uniref:Uncharacterized protein n=1 Tax=Rhododendron molle TaxID=49168 RepID=A0ACC0MGS7_RHOML|nr:hypothetical protein RHMOL_Rhmol09G0192500 [Rhododendron molle]